LIFSPNFGDPSLISQFYSNEMSIYENDAMYAAAGAAEISRLFLWLDLQKAAKMVLVALNQKWNVIKMRFVPWVAKIGQ
jgi:hypothetical protein